MSTWKILAIVPLFALGIGAAGFAASIRFGMYALATKFDGSNLNIVHPMSAILYSALIVFALTFAFGAFIAIRFAP